MTSCNREIGSITRKIPQIHASHGNTEFLSVSFHWAEWKKKYQTKKTKKKHQPQNKQTQILKSLMIWCIRNTSMCAFCPASQVYVGLHQKEGGQQVKAAAFPPLFHPCEVPPALLPPGLEPSTEERCGAIGEGPAKCHEDNQRVRASLLWSQAESGSFSLEKRQLRMIIKVSSNQNPSAILWFSYSVLWGIIFL